MARVAVLFLIFFLIFPLTDSYLSGNLPSGQMTFKSAGVLPALFLLVLAHQFNSLTINGLRHPMALRKSSVTPEESMICTLKTCPKQGVTRRSILAARVTSCGVAVPKLPGEKLSSVARQERSLPRPYRRRAVALGEIFSTDRQAADAFAGGGKDGVANRGRDHR